ncbi:MAG: FAD-dependent monooxygenase [Thermodesulfovibrionales bacterium]|nr:FAD-dependent monooxygenase [Thermodesulfovibrionales bacterium]
MLRTKVLIIGGGPAGSTSARFLAENSIDTILLERDMSYIKPCGGGIASTALHELNIPESVLKNKINKIRIVSPKGEDIGIHLTGGHLCVTERGEFDSKSREMAGNKGASVIEAEFIGFEKTGKHIISVARKKASNEEIKITSDYVVAADGITFKAGSCVKAAGLKYLYTLSASLKTADSDTCEFWFSSNHASNFYSWIFPSKEHSSIGTGSTNPRELTSLLNNFTKRRFDASVKGLASENYLGKLRAFRIPEWRGNLFNIRNIFFAGDASGSVMPVTYEGIYYAMKSGEFIARAVIEGKTNVYKKLWNSRFKNRFLLMNRIKQILFKNAENIEKWVALHKRPEVQEIAIKLWLRKETDIVLFFS